MDDDATNGWEVESIPPVKIPIEDTIDLHTFRPRDVSSLLEEYLAACREEEIFSVRIVHGKGSGRLKDHVRKVLQRLPVVASFEDAPLEAGGWGATIVTLK